MATPTPSLAQIDQFRRMVAEPTADTYSDAALRMYIVRYPLRDSVGALPADALWAGAWDMSRAAGDVWAEKASLYAADFDFNADGGDYKRSQVHKQMLDMARRFRAGRQANSVALAVWPLLLSSDRYAWIGNLPQEDD